MRKNAKRIFIIDILILIVVAIALGVSMIWSRAIELSLGLLYEVPADSVDASEIVTLQSGVSVSSDGGAELKVHFVDVKQGDCILIELPDGKNMIIDAGSGTNAPKAIINSVMSYIPATFGADFKYFDYAILTHADSDHCNVLDDVLAKYPSYVCYRPNMEATGTGYTDPGKAALTSGAGKQNTAAYRNAISAMYQTIEGVDTAVYVTDPKVDAQTIVGGDGDDAYSLTFFSPLSDKYSNINDYSPIMLLEYRGFKFALSGDAEAKNEEEFVKKVAAAPNDGVEDKYDIFTDEFTVDVFKAGHHGSKTSSSQAYLDIMTTADGAANAYYVFSCNAVGNTYYHPNQAVLDRIVAMGATNDKIVRTDHHGTIMFTVACDEDGYALSCSTQIAYDGDNTIGADNDGSSGGNTGDNNGDGDDDNNGSDDNNGDDDNTGDNNGDGGDDNNGGDNDGDDEKPDDEPEDDWVFVYQKLGSIKLTWAVVAWGSYAVLVVLMAAHMVWVSVGGSAGPKAKGGGRKR